MKRFFNYLIILLVFLGCTTLNAGSGPLFKVTDTGNPGRVEVALCLNGKGPLSCQKYITKALTLSISTVIAKHNYPNAGIKIITPGYTIASGCTRYTNGYCLFSVNATTPRVITLHQNNHYTLGGTISGLVGSVTLKSLVNGELVVQKNDGSFTFPNTLANGTPYQVIILKQPAQPFHCTLSHGKGVIQGSNVTNIKVVCSEQTGVASGSIIGLTNNQTVVLQNNDIDPQTKVGPASSFSFPAQAVGSDYVVTVKKQPSAETCSVSHGVGVMVNGGVNTIKVACSVNTYSVGGSISGLAAGQTVVLQNNGTDPLSKSANGAFTFPTKIADGSDYEVTVKTQPQNQTCTVSGGNGTMGGANINSVLVSCVADTTKLSLSTSSLVVPVNGSSVVTVTNTGSFTARNVVANLPAGWTNVSAEPSSKCAALAPQQTCTIKFTSLTYQPYVAQGGIIVTGENTPTPPSMAIAFSYQSYLVMSVDTSSTMTVVYTSDFGGSVPPGWDVSNGCQYGTCAVTNATSFVNGAYLNSTGNTYKIISTIGTQPIVNTYNAAGTCYNINSDNTGAVPNGTWYLPTICQLGGTGEGAGCPSGIANMNANLYQLGFGGFASSGSSAYGFKSYWSSNENTSNSTQAWLQNFNANNTSNQLVYYKTFSGLVRCVRSITY